MTIPATITNGFHEKLYPDMFKRFAKDVADHRMTVLHDDGLYRHLRFTRPGTGLYWFEITTWPGSLAIRGDMGSFMFSRLPDMFEFFGTGDINPGYWAEKTPNYGVDAAVRRYSPETFESTIKQLAKEFLDGRPGWEAVPFYQLLQEDVLEHSQAHHEAVEAADRFVWEGQAVFSNIFGSDFRDYTPQFLWCCLALPFAIRHYQHEKGTP